MAKEKEDLRLVWNWKKKSFTLKSETDTKESSIDPKKDQWTKEEPRPRHQDFVEAAKHRKELLVPKGFSDVPFITEEMEGLDVVIWDIQMHEWSQGIIDEVYFHDRGFLVYVVVATSRGKLKAYVLDQLKIEQQTECKVEVAA